MPDHIIEGKIKDVKYENCWFTAYSATSLGMILRILSNTGEPKEVSVKIYGYLPFKKGQKVKLHYGEGKVLVKEGGILKESQFETRQGVLTLIETDDFSFEPNHLRLKQNTYV